MQYNTVIFKKGNGSGSSAVTRLADKEIDPNVKCILSQDPGFYLHISNSIKIISIELMKQILKRKDTIEKEIGFNLTWTLSDKRAQYVSFYYDDDLEIISKFSMKLKISVSLTLSHIKLDRIIHNIDPFFQLIFEC